MSLHISAESWPSDHFCSPTHNQIKSELKTEKGKMENENENPKLKPKRILKAIFGSRMKV